MRISPDCNKYNNRGKLQTLHRRKFPLSDRLLPFPLALFKVKQCQFCHRPRYCRWKFLIGRSCALHGRELGESVLDFRVNEFTQGSHRRRSFSEDKREWLLHRMRKRSSEIRLPEVRELMLLCPDPTSRNYPGESTLALQHGFMVVSSKCLSLATSDPIE